MKLVKTLMLLALTAAVVVPSLGCGVGTTPEENSRSIRRVADYDARMLVDDVGLLIMTNRTFRTSRWVID